MKLKQLKKRIKRIKKRDLKKGAVSVFLVLILVPCLLVTSLFVDLSRVKLSKSQASSSADLALNSLMTNYDADLNEWYGLVSSCQNIDEFYEISADYFLRMLSSQDLSKDEVMLLSDYYAAATQNGAIYDSLQDFFGYDDEPTKKASDLIAVDVQTDSKDIVSAVEGANMANATMIKNQLIEFLKYRAPIDLAEELIDRIKNQDDTISAVSDAAEQKPLVDSKQEFYETEGKFTSAAFRSYWAIRDYSDMGITKDKIKSDYIDKYKEYEKAYKKMHKNTYKYLLNTDGLSTYSIEYRDLSSFENTYSRDNSEVYSYSENGEYFINDSDMKSYINDLGAAYKDLNDYFNGINGNHNLSDLAGMDCGFDAGQNNPVQWWVKANKEKDSSLDDLSDKADAFMKAYAKAKLLSDESDDKKLSRTAEAQTFWDKKDNDTNDGGYRYSLYNNDKTYQELIDLADSLYKKYLNSSTIDTDTNYYKFVSKLSQISNDNKDKIDVSKYKVTVDGQEKSYEDAIKYISEQLDDKIAELDKAIKYLDIAIDGKGKVKKLDKLKELAGQYHDDLGGWNDEAFSRDTDPVGDGQESSMWQQDQTEINNRTQDECIDKITEENVEALKTRLTNIRTLLKNVKGMLNDMEYCGKKVKDITSFDKFKDRLKSKVNVNDIPMKNSELDSNADSSFSFKTDSESNTNAGNQIDDDAYDPTLDPETGNNNIPELYKYMHEAYKDKQDKKDAVDEAEDDQDKAKDAQKEKEEAAKTGDLNGTLGDHDIKNSLGDGKIATNDSAFGLDDVLKGVCDTVGKFFTGDALDNLGDMRDTLYTTTYIREMFSYSTYEKEGCYNLVKKDGKAEELNLKNAENTYKNYMGSENPANPTDNQGKWLSTLLTDDYNKSMTNKLINGTNNFAYTGEIEYILYGQKNQDNMNKAIGQIYTIRYGLNLVSGFQHFWSGDNATAACIDLVAVTIASLTGGIIPTPVTKVILIPLLTVFETFIDMQRLKKGFPVELYKKEVSMWWFSLSGDIRSVGSFLSSLSNIKLDEHPNPDKGLFYSDYLTFFLISGLSSSKTSQVMYERMAEVIQMNMRYLIGHGDVSKSSYKLENSVVYFKLEAEVRVRPLMVALPTFVNFNSDFKDQKDWCTYKISTTRGYS